MDSDENDFRNGFRLYSGLWQDHNVKQGCTDRLVRIRSRFSKFCWPWSDPVLGRGPKRSVRDQPVLVRGSHL